MQISKLEIAKQTKPKVILILVGTLILLRPEILCLSLCIRIE